MRKGDAQIGRPAPVYTDAKATVEAITGVVEGATAYASDTDEFGTYDGAAWTWGTGGGSGLWGIELEGSTDTEGVDYVTTTGSSYTYLEAQILAKVPFKIETLYWDLAAGTYTLSIDSIDYGAPHVLGAPVDDESWDLSANDLIITRGTHYIRMTRSVTGQWRYYNTAGGFDGTYWENIDTLFAGASFPQFVCPLKLEVYPGTWAQDV